jgi:hypothetical protein
MAHDKSVGYYLKRGIDPRRLHVTNYDGSMIGTIHAVTHDKTIIGYETRLDVRYFNGEPWDTRPHPSTVYVIER